MDRKYAEYLLGKTQKDYNLISDDFTRTRAFIPDDVKEMAEYAKPGDKVLDLGCGNGRFYELVENKNIDYTGVDNSKELIEICKKRYPGAKFQTADGFKLPFSDNYFDKVFSVSVLHHIPSKELQLEFLKESKRVLKPEGLLVMRVWDFWKRKIFPKLFFKYTLLKIIGKSQLDFKDVFWPWREGDGKIKVDRYFHCFTKKELENITKEAGFKINKSWKAGKDPRSNIYLVAQK